MWTRIVRWLAREYIAYLECENRKLRYEGERWQHRYEGAMDCVRVFERRSHFMEQTIYDAAVLNPVPPMATSVNSASQAAMIPALPKGEK